MRIDPLERPGTYLHLYADCIPVKGALRAAIYDLTRHELIFFPAEYYDVLEWLTSDAIGNLLGAVDSKEEKAVIESFIDFLDENEFITFLKDPSMFPPLEERWDTPSVIQNAVIDVDLLQHDFKKIFTELDALGCQFVQIRCFSDLLTLDDIYSLISQAYHKSIHSIELIVKYDTALPDEAYRRLVEDEPMISSLTLHSAPQERTLIIDYGCDDEAGRFIKRHVRITPQVIDSNIHCGLITVRSLHAPSINNFFETKFHNGCLNRKVSVDAFGNIRNCPSMPATYGNITDTNIGDAINGEGFKEKWEIRKDQVKVCRDCEFRYACSDCRAYVEDPADIYSKPLKCGYDPYTGQWEEWSANPLKQQAIAYYGISIFKTNDLPGIQATR